MENKRTEIKDDAGNIWALEYKAAAAALGRKGGSSTSAAKRAASAANGQRGGRPAQLYTVREPGCAYYWQGRGKRAAQQALREARALGLTRAVIVTE